MPWSAQFYINFFSSVGQLCLVLIAVRRWNRSVLAVPLALVYLSIFGFTTADLMEDVSHSQIWNALSHLLATFIAPLALEFVLTFVGKRRRHSRSRWLWWIPVILTALIPIAGLFSALAHHLDKPRDQGGAGLWASALLLVAVPAMALALRELWLHFRTAGDPLERARARLTLLATGLGAPFALTDLLHSFLPGLAQLAKPTLLGVSAVFLYAAMRQRLLEDELHTGALSQTLLAAGAAVGGYVLLVRATGAHPGLFLLGSFLGAVTLTLLGLRLAHLVGAGRARQRQLALLGRFSTQLAHDLKNPLAAVKGAGQFLLEEIRRGPVSAEAVRGSLELMLAQVDRIHDTIDRYQRLGSVVPVAGPLDLNRLVGRVLSLQGFASGGRVELRCQLSPDLPLCRADESLVGTAIDNLVKNAAEAIVDRGNVVVRSTVAGPAEPPGVILTIEDDGAGMDVRKLERAFDEFYTTKAGGSGLGLSFARRVVEAHGGAISISSAEGRGTTVRLRLPLA